MDGFDLRKYQEGGDKHDEVKAMLGKILSGRDGYETIIDKTREIPKCEECKTIVEDCKFCPKCGHPVKLECGVKNCEAVVEVGEEEKENSG